MKLSEIVKHAQKTLPLYTNKFSNTVDVEKLTSVDRVVTIRTKTNHDLEVGQYVVIEGARIKNTIVSLTNEHGLGRLVTQFPHQITKNVPLREGDSTSVKIEGAEEVEYNGTFRIMDIPNSNVIEFDINEDAPATATGAPFLLQDSYANYNGRHKVSAIIDAQTFQVELERTPQTNFALGDIKIRNGVRISGEYSIEHALDAYEATTRDELWGFCIIEGTNASKSKVNRTDAIATYLKGADVRIELVQDFNFYVIVPTTSEYCWIDFVDLAQILRTAILKTFHKARFVSGLTDTECNLAFIGDNPVDTTTRAFMVWQYKFQTTINLQNADGIERHFEPAIREFELHQKNKEGTGANEIYSYSDIPDIFIEDNGQ